MHEQSLINAGAQFAYVNMLHVFIITSLQTEPLIVRNYF